jgi:ribonucleotide monophosphatase NagD (HAD superfamily)
LLEQFGQYCTVLTIGGGLGLADELKRVGITQIALETCSLDEINSVRKSRNDLLLLLGWTKEISYEAFTKVLQLSENIVHVFATDNDRYFSSDIGNLPGTAWLNGSIASLLDVEIISFGKPNPASLSLALRKIHATPSSTLLIGDNLFVDIQVGKALGCNTVLVLGGVSTLSDIQLLDSKMKPDYVINELSDLVDYKL